MREDRRRGGRRREKAAVTSGHGQSAVLNKNDGFLDLGLHKAVELVSRRMMWATELEQ